ncbi:hypothetical protein N0U25_28730, partial [Pseudomonas sivasensis]|nr:hypothetical protein [Pseudomonas sivasensis]
PLVDIEAVNERFPPDQVEAFIAIGDSQLNRVRARYYDLMKARGYALASYVSSRAFVWHNVKIGDNCFVLEDNTAGLRHRWQQRDFVERQSYRSSFNYRRPRIRHFACRSIWVLQAWRLFIFRCQRRYRK